jgi:predicted nucleic acid-binding protein
MTLLDSNLLIYASKSSQNDVLAYISNATPYASAISQVETLGYHRLETSERHSLEALFRTLMVLPVTPAIIAGAIRLRQQRKMSLGDALIAATALEHELTLATHNTKDFDWIEALRVHDPLA